MATITTQAQLNALNTTNAPQSGLYLDTSTISNVALGNLEITTINGDVTLPAGSLYIGDSIASGPDSPSTFTGDGATINFVGVSSNADSFWRTGMFRARNAIITMTSTQGAGGNQAWPGFTEPTVTDNNGNFLRGTIDIQGSTLRSGYTDGATVLSRPTNGWNFQCPNALALAGNNINGVTFGDGVALTYTPSMFRLANINWSGQQVNIGTSPVYIRIQTGRYGNLALENFQWDGFFNNDMSQWASNLSSLGYLSINNSQTGNQQIFNSGFTTYLVDNTYSADVTQNGLQLYAHTDGVFDMQYVVGVGFNPFFRDSVNTTSEVTDVEFNAGNRTVHFTQALATPTDVPDQNTLLATQNADADGDNFIAVNGREGYILQTQDTQSFSASAAGTGRIMVAGNVATIPYWSYTHKSYSAADGASNSAPRENPVWTDVAVTSSVVAEQQAIDLIAEGAILNNRNKPDAETLIANGLSDAQDFFPVAKSLYVDGKIR